MLYFSLVFLVIALIAAVLGLTGMAGAAQDGAWILCVMGLVLAVVFFVRADLTHRSRDE